MNTFKKIILLTLPLLVFACKKSDDNNVDQAAIDKAILLKYIADNSLLVDSTASGLYYQIITPGSDRVPNLNSLITVSYKGYFINGTVFDQTSGTTIEGLLRQFIAGWQEGIPKIQKGGKIKLLIPSALAYGKNGSGTIPPNTVLIFDVDLVNVE